MNNNPIDLIELARQHEAAQQRSDRAARNSGFQLLLIGFVVLSVSTLFLAQKAIREFSWFGPTQTTTSEFALRLSPKVQVQAQETINNAWDGMTFKYTFRHHGHLIASLDSERQYRQDDAQSRFKTGQSQNIPYFYQDRLLAIYQPKTSRWLVWDCDGGSLLDSLRDKSPVDGIYWETGQEPANIWKYDVVKFQAKSNIWIITLHNHRAKPKYEYIESRNLGQTWKLR